MAVIGYIRVSTDKQTYKHQHFEIEQYAKNQGLKIDDWIEETIEQYAKNYGLNIDDWV